MTRAETIFALISILLAFVLGVQWGRPALPVGMVNISENVSTFKATGQGSAGPLEITVTAGGGGGSSDTGLFTVESGTGAVVHCNEYGCRP